MDKSAHLVTALCYCLLSPILSWSQIIRRERAGLMNIGQGDAILAMSPKRECVMLIDSGDSRYPDSSKNFKAYIQDKLPIGQTKDAGCINHPSTESATADRKQNR